jgi:hypothetical protein
MEKLKNKNAYIIGTPQGIGALIAIEEEQQWNVMIF